MSDVANDKLDGAIVRLQQEYVAEFPARLAELRKDVAALGAGESDAAASIKTRLHKLAGSGGSYGFPELSRVAREAEQRIDGQPGVDPETVGDLNKTIAELAQLMDQAPDTLLPDDGTRPLDFGWRAHLIGHEAGLIAALMETLTASGFTVTSGSESTNVNSIPVSARPDLLVIVGDAKDFDTHAMAAAWTNVRSIRPRGVVLIDTGESEDHFGAVAAGVDAIFQPDQIATDFPQYAKTLARIGVPPSCVLLVEDDLAQAQLVASTLEAANIRVNHAEDAARARELLAQETPDLILLDVGLPDLDGFTLARLIRQDPRYSLLPIVFLTARSSLASHVEALRAGADDFLTKPIDQSLNLLLQAVITRAERGRRIREMVHKDGLTGLLNHATLMTELENAVEYADRNIESFTFLMIDIDHFKRVNDRYGHLVGDQVLLHVARIFQNTARSSDVIGRYGGEEFGIILRRSNPIGAAAVAEKLRTALRERPATTEGGEEVPVRVSIGIASYPEDGATASSLAHAADLALYRAKSDGRDRVKFADPEGLDAEPSEEGAGDEA
jgi:diguanylate cyclase (GGDEF)-like protein